MSRKNYRKIYIEHHGRIPTDDDDGRSYEIHHIDGDHENNDISNLLCIPIHEHYDIHYKQGDFGSCFAMAIRMKKTVEELREISSLAGKKSADTRIKSGAHNFLDKDWSDSCRQRELSKVANGTHYFTKEYNTYIARQRVVNKTHNFQGENAPSQQNWACEVCGISGKGKGNHTRFHGEKCKSKLKSDDLP